MSVPRPVQPHIVMSKFLKKTDLYNERLARIKAAADKNKRGVIPLIVAGLIALAVLVGGGIAALVATGNSGQVATCVESLANSDPAALGSFVAGLSTNVEADAETAIAALGPDLAKCLLQDLLSDAEVLIAQKAAAKANKPAAPAAQLKVNAQYLLLKHGWSSAPAGTSGGTTGK